MIKQIPFMMMTLCKHASILIGCLSAFLGSLWLHGENSKYPFITTQSPLTLFSTQDAELTVFRRGGPTVMPETYELNAQDSFTVIHLGPDHPPVVKTVYGTIACSILGTPTMAVSPDGHYGFVINHSFRTEGSIFERIQYPPDQPLTNRDMEKVDLGRQDLSPQLADIVSVVDLHDPSHPVVDRILLESPAMHLMIHPDGKRYFALGLTQCHVLEFEGQRLRLLDTSDISYGEGCFWMHPDGKHILAGRSPSMRQDIPAILEWYEILGNKVRRVCEIRNAPSLDVTNGSSGCIVRITPDGRRGFICQRTFDNGKDLCDVMIADLTLDEPLVTHVIPQVNDGLESFAFHPNGKMAVVTCLENPSKNSLAVLDIESDPPRLLYHLDAAAASQGVEFAPEGDKLFLGSPVHGRIEIYDVVGDFELVKNPKFIKIGYGHNSLSMGSRYRH
jgi:hypothetical protein